MRMDEREKVRKPAGVKNRLSASCGQENSCKIPPSYKISQETLEKVERLMREDVSDTVAILKVLYDPMRLRILKALRIDKIISFGVMMTPAVVIINGEVKASGRIPSTGEIIIKVVKFEPTRPCPSCTNLGDFAKETIELHFQEDYKSGKIIDFLRLLPAGNP